MVKPLTFKGDKRPKKRKHRDEDYTERDHDSKASSLVPTTATAAANDYAADEQSWVSADIPTDINGPVIFVLPSSPPTCIACDANGKVFASQLENVIENEPSTAEPHDVRQVWVATRVAGTEGFGFKGHHGRYLSCDKFGILSATASAISPFESFIAIQAHDTPGMFAFQTRGGESETDSFVAIQEDGDETTKNKKATSVVEIRGDASSISFESTLRVRMQARFKPKLKASKETKAKEKISRRELEAAVGRRLDDDEIKRLKRARKEGNYYEEILDVRVKGKHDKFAS
ncbi:FRG1-like family-domain-containing protein [Talaromyces proteolyticus]|uniref:FRG1-like family-domain-containing protein n=1 Tax=Talaromyces proteolyticus TaxID=1131652 RepID=A0AAD4KV40_9EURO|nr:FRG1-like family-domain-containing protein [Talaromyces proteolyticus]KAH8700540.1 FRG1-like family-domain-containing protein [Talaromyces proteolyticus]